MIQPLQDGQRNYPRKKSPKRSFLSRRILVALEREKTPPTPLESKATCLDRFQLCFIRLYFSFIERLHVLEYSIVVESPGSADPGSEEARLLDKLKLGRLSPPPTALLLLAHLDGGGLELHLLTVSERQAPKCLGELWH